MGSGVNVGAGEGAGEGEDVGSCFLCFFLLCVFFSATSTDPLCAAVLPSGAVSTVCCDACSVGTTSPRKSTKIAAAQWQRLSSAYSSVFISVERRIQRYRLCHGSTNDLIAPGANR